MLAQGTETLKESFGFTGALFLYLDLIPVNTYLGKSIHISKRKSIYQIL